MQTLIKLPVSDAIRNTTNFRNFERRKEHLNFVCKRLRQIIDLNQNKRSSFSDLYKFQKEISTSREDEQRCKPISIADGLPDNMFVNEGNQQKNYSNILIFSYSEHKIRTCLPTKTGSTSWSITLSQIAEPDKEEHHQWEYSERLAENAVVMDEQVKSKIGELGWVTFMTVRHPMARLYSAQSAK